MSALLIPNVGAEEGERIGLVNRIAPEGQLRETATEVAQSIAANGPIAVRAAKDAIDGGSEMAIRDGLEHEARCYERVLGTEDRLEARRVPDRPEGGHRRLPAQRIVV